MRPLELWAGIECTLNRVGDRYFDQLEWSGHRDQDSGPPDTSLLDPGFPAGLAAHAAAVAERYPWIEDWTPVNEPRFIPFRHADPLINLTTKHAPDERIHVDDLAFQIACARSLPTAEL